MKVFLIALFAFFAATSSPASATNYIYEVPSDGAIVLPQIDLTKERVDYIIPLFSGSFQFSVRAYGEGLEVAPYGHDVQYAAIFNIFDQYGKRIGFGGFSDGATFAENTQGPVGTFIDYSFPYDFSTHGYDYTDGDISAYDGSHVEFSFYPTPYDGASFTNVQNHLSLVLITSPVPELATWLMMLIGFGMIGFAARRHSSVKTTVAYA